MEYCLRETWVKSRNNNNLSMFYPWVPLQEHTHHLHVRSHTCTFKPKPHLSVHTWVLTSCCAFDTAWVVHILDVQPLLSHSHILSSYLSQHNPWVSWCPHGNLYLHHLTSEERRPWCSSSCGFWMHAHKGWMIQRKRSRNEQRKKARSRQSERLSVSEVSVGHMWAQ